MSELHCLAGGRLAVLIQSNAGNLARALRQRSIQPECPSGDGRRVQKLRQRLAVEGQGALRSTNPCFIASGTCGRRHSNDGHGEDEKWCGKATSDRVGSHPISLHMVSVDEMEGRSPDDFLSHSELLCAGTIWDDGSYIEESREHREPLELTLPKFDRVEAPRWSSCSSVTVS